MTKGDRWKVRQGWRSLGWAMQPSSGEPETGEPDARKRARPVRGGRLDSLATKGLAVYLIGCPFEVCDIGRSHRSAQRFGPKETLCPCSYHDQRKAGHDGPAGAVRRCALGTEPLRGDHALGPR